uniref:Mediator of RNA polymerase II transcription subunit 8 n=1 Tax=Rodentolepis nana TaxID=102285 RepID=A0A0R3TNA6_RODNA
LYLFVSCLGFWSLLVCFTTRLVMEVSERQQLDSFLLLQPTTSKLKQKLSELLYMIENHRDNIDWPKYLNTLGLCASELVEIRKILESERFASATSMILTPRSLSTEPDPNLAKATEDRLHTFNHEAAPQYLRTKLDPQVESLRIAVDARADQIQKSQAISPKQAINLHEKLVGDLLEDMRSLKFEMEQDQEKLIPLKSSANPEDLLSLVSIMTVGREYTLKGGGPK